MVQHVEQVKHKDGNAAPQASLDAHGVAHNRPLTPEAVSYTHLTLPTICSV